jgi:hypothetical protein
MVSARMVDILYATAITGKAPGCLARLATFWAASRRSGTAILSGGQYADIAFLDAICSYHNDDMSAAMAAYDQGVSMFDGVG